MATPEIERFRREKPALLLAMKDEDAVRGFVERAGRGVVPATTLLVGKGDRAAAFVLTEAAGLSPDGDMLAERFMWQLGRLIPTWWVCERDGKLRAHRVRRDSYPDDEGTPLMRLQWTGRASKPKQPTWFGSEQVIEKVIETLKAHFGDRFRERVELNRYFCNMVCDWSCTSVTNIDMVVDTPHGFVAIELKKKANPSLNPWPHYGINIGQLAAMRTLSRRCGIHSIYFCINKNERKDWRWRLITAKDADSFMASVGGVPLVAPNHTSIDTTRAQKYWPIAENSFGRCGPLSDGGVEEAIRMVALDLRPGRSARRPSPARLP